MNHLTEEEISRLFHVARERDQRYYLALLLGYNHGLRVSEIAAIRSRDIVDGWLTVKRLKGSEKTSQPLTDDERAMVEAYCITLQRNQRLFPVSRVMLWKVFKKYCVLAGIARIPGRGIHSLKHSIAHHTIHGAGIAAVQKYLGHKSMASTGAYLKLSDSAASSAVQGAMRKI